MAKHFSQESELRKVIDKISGILNELAKCNKSLKNLLSSNLSYNDQMLIKSLMKFYSYNSLLTTDLTNIYNTRVLQYEIYAKFINTMNKVDNPHINEVNGNKEIDREIDKEIDQKININELKTIVSNISCKNNDQIGEFPDIEGQIEVGIYNLSIYYEFSDNEGICGRYCIQLDNNTIIDNEGHIYEFDTSQLSDNIRCIASTHKLEYKLLYDIVEYIITKYMYDEKYKYDNYW